MPEAPRGPRGPRRRSARLRQPFVRRVRAGGRGVLRAEIVRILGVDPGSERTGWALIGGDVHAPVLIDCGEIRAASRSPFALRLVTLKLELARIVAAAAPGATAVESPFHGTNARSALQLAHARGVILCVLAEAGFPPFEYSPATVKKTVSGNGRADKEQIRAMVARLTGREPDGMPLDVADAVAVALCHQSHMRTARFRA